MLLVCDEKTVNDTVNIALIKKDSKQQNLKGKGEPNVLKLITLLNVSKDAPFDLNKNLELSFSHPIAGKDLSKIILTTGKEILKTEVRLMNEKAKRKMELKYSFKEKTKYQIFIPKGAIMDIFGLPNDTIKIEFKTREKKEYGTLKLKYVFTEKSGNYIVQLMDEKENIVREKSINGSETVVFDYLKPSQYKLKIIYDENKNGKWDTGNYLKKLQPEKVIYYTGTIKVKSNWEQELEWKVK